MRKVSSENLIKKIKVLNNKAVLNTDKIISKSIKNLEEVQNCKSNFLKKMISCSEKNQNTVLTILENRKKSIWKNLNKALDIIGV